MPPPRALNLPPLTRGLLLALLALSALNVSLRLRKWRASVASDPSLSSPAHVSNYLSNPRYGVGFLVVIPTYSIRFPWTFLTAALVENNLISLAISVAVLWFGGRYLERAWGQREFAVFMLCTAFVPNLVAFGAYALWHMVTGRRPEFPTPIQGLVAVEAGFLVALKQLVPEHTVSILRGAVRVRVKHFPALFALANILSGPLLGTDTASWLSLTGFLTSWIYLRFYRHTEIGPAAPEDAADSVTIRGDASDTFAFVAFFPDPFRPFLDPVCDAVYNTLVHLGVCAPFSDQARENAAANRRWGEGLPGPGAGGGADVGASGGGRRAEAERRRALALRALDQKLNAAATASASPSASSRPAPAAAVTVSNATPALAGDTPAPVAGEEGVGVEEREVVKDAQD